MVHGRNNNPYGVLLAMLLVLGCGDSPMDHMAQDVTVMEDVQADIAGDTALPADGVEEPPPIGFAPPSYCGSCHENHYNQWRSSMHAYATKDPVFQAMLKKGQEETEGKLDQFCVQCHAPVASLKEMLPVEVVDGVHQMELDFDNPFVAHGVQCSTCHSISKVHATQNADVELSEATYFGPTGSEEANQFHPMEKSALFHDPAQESLLCGSCHDVLNPNGARLEATFSEWYSNEFNDPLNPEKHRTCQDCHMKAYQGEIVKGGEVKTLHSHQFVGVDQALIPDFPGKEEQAALVKELLQDCAELTVDYNGVVEGHVELVVNVKNINNGHNLPSGSTADRQVWVHLEVFNEDGMKVLESGMLDANGDLMDGVVGHSLNPDGDPELLAFGQFIFDKNGDHALFPWQAVTYTDHLIGPGQTAWRDFQIPHSLVAGQQLEVQATLYYRTFPPFLIRALEDEGYLEEGELLEIPIIEMETLTKAVFVSN